jgi:uncharacterized protein (TIGR00730 family)
MNDPRASADSSAPRPARQQPLPWQRPKETEDDPEAQRRVRAIIDSPSYRQADEDVDFLGQDEIRGLRLQLDYSKAELQLCAHGVERTVVVFGGTRIPEPAAARRTLDARRAELMLAPHDKALRQRVQVAERVVAKSHYYDIARELGRLIGQCGDCGLRLITGGGPGIMEAANRGAFDVGASSIGLNITLPHEQFPNPYVTPELCLRFHYFALRKLHFLKRACALVAFPGGYGTLDELFETLTLVQTRKISPMPIVLVGEAYWRRAVDIDFMVEEGVIDAEDRELFRYAETADAAWQQIRHWHAGNGSPLSSWQASSTEQGA